MPHFLGQEHGERLRFLRHDGGSVHRVAGQQGASAYDAVKIGTPGTTTKAIWMYMNLHVHVDIHGYIDKLMYI